MGGHVLLYLMKTLSTINSLGLHSVRGVWGDDDVSPQKNLQKQLPFGLMPQILLGAPDPNTWRPRCKGINSCPKSLFPRLWSNGGGGQAVSHGDDSGVQNFRLLIFCAFLGIYFFCKHISSFKPQLHLYQRNPHLKVMHSIRRSSRVLTVQSLPNAEANSSIAPLSGDVSGR